MSLQLRVSPTNQRVLPESVEHDAEPGLRDRAHTPLPRDVADAGKGNGWETDFSESVRRLYAGYRGAVLPTLSALSLHVALSERWFQQREFDLRGARRILDVGCGAGQLTQHLLKHADREATIMGCDLTWEMLLRARRRVRHDAVQWVVGNLTHLPFDEASFDCVTCGFVLEHLPDVRRGLHELARVLTDGGRLLLLTTEDHWTGRWTARAWNCRALNRQELRRQCQEAGLVWKQDLWFSEVHRWFAVGGICVSLERASRCHSGNG